MNAVWCFFRVEPVFSVIPAKAGIQFEETNPEWRDLAEK